MATSVTDPVHGSIRLDDWVVPLIDHPVFQRLRRIQQLGTAHLVYPGAHHRRFEHSLGAYHLAGLLADQLGLQQDDALTLRAAALLHDVGHGPFSHAFEELARETGHRHEATSVDLVRWGPLADLLRQGGLDPVAVSEAVVGEGPLSSIVSGALDADRMDYLLRDAHYTGVQVSVDPDRLRRVVRLHEEHGIILGRHGILPAEGLLTTRFLMYPAVYFHHSVRASEAMLLQAIREHISDGAASLERLRDETDDGLLHRIRTAGGIGAGMVLRLDERRLYKRAWWTGADRFDEDIFQRCIEDPRHERRLSQEIADEAGVDEHEVLMDVPRPPRFHEAKLMVRQDDERIVPITQASRLVRSLQEARLDHWRAWVFAPKQLRDTVGEAASKVLG